MSSSDEQRKLAAIMFTDMVGYGALSQRDDKLALELLEEHREILRKIFPRFHGTEIKTIGDAFLIEFNSALEAAQCAIEIQRALAHRNHDVGAERRIELKIGIHIGDVVHRAGDVYGDGVNIASRIEPLAGAGGICVSIDVERQIRNAVETRFEKLAPAELKNISVPMELFRVVLPWERAADAGRKSEIGNRKSKIGEQRRSLSIKPLAVVGILIVIAIAIGWLWTTRSHKSSEGGAAATPNSEGLAGARAPIPEKSIAVLPFENLSSDKDNAYFAEGIQDEILTRLAKIADLKVIARSSTLRFQNKGDLPQIAQQLGVAHLLEGSVQKVNDEVRVNVQLIKAATEAHLWAEVYDRKLIDIFAVESEIAKTIADTLQAKLTGSEQHVIAARPTDNTEAHQLYLKGRFFWNKRTGNDLKKSLDYFQQAIAADPNYALAYAGVADAYVFLPGYTAGAPGDCYPKAMAAAKKALELDDTLAEAHTTLALAIWYYEFDFVQANKEFERAIELNPNYATGHQQYGNNTLSALGRFDDSIAEGKRAVELDPLSLVINTDLGVNYLFARRYDEAITQLRKTLEIDPGYYYAYVNLGQAFAAKRDFDQAIQQYQKARALNDDPFVLGLLGHAYARSGNKTETLKILDQLKQLTKQRYVSAYSFVIVYVGLDDKAEALYWLERCYQDHAGSEIAWIRVDPLVDPLRSDPRFEAIAAKIVPAREFRGSSK
ncbi:MAG TPA: adenylate/guanylate cyclase domain-containing protein [Candidatus Udaeobacter sp.]|nr:adenylate/guanylate cyclase domain-containing protein [Candidatus Udaeobacter sp.]